MCRALQVPGTHTPSRWTCRNAPSSRPKSAAPPSCRRQTGPRGPTGRRHRGHRQAVSRISNAHRALPWPACRGSLSTCRQTAAGLPLAGWHRGPVQCRTRGSFSPDAANSAHARPPASCHALRRRPSIDPTGRSAFRWDGATPSPVRPYRPPGSHQPGTCPTRSGDTTATGNACSTKRSQGPHPSRFLPVHRGTSARQWQRHPIASSHRGYRRSPRLRP